jgi:hypothetical protein
LSRDIYLGSEYAKQAEGWHPANHTTPASYFGNLSDVGAYVSAAAMLQMMRNKWNSTPDRFFSLYNVPLAKAITRYTDPVLGASFLRATRAHEIGSIDGHVSLETAALQVAHDPVVAAEIMLANLEGKFLATDAIRARAKKLLRAFPQPISDSLEALFED